MPNSKKGLVNPIDDSFQLWSQIKSEAGLSISTGKSEGGYDDGFIKELNVAIFGNDSENFEDRLRRESRTVSTTQLLKSFLSALQPFSQMLLDTLEMLNAADASKSSETMSVSFDFSGDDPLTLLLSEFKEQARILEASIVQKPAIEFSARRLWQVIYDLRESRGDYWGERNPDGRRDALNQWIEQSQDYHGPKIFEDIPEEECFTGLPAVDIRLAKLVSYVQLVSKASKLRASSYSELGDYGSEVRERGDPMQEVDGIPGDELWLLQSDFWPASMVAIIAGVVRRVGSSENGANDFIDRFDAVELPEVFLFDDQELLEKLQDILNLPVWKHRHEMYSVWVGSRIWFSLSDCVVIFHTVDSILSFSFSGSHLATIVPPHSGSVLSLWAEKRKEVSAGSLKGKGRKSAIQPDYTVLRAPFSEKDAERLIVEVKQYKKYSRRNFSEALNDYATSCPEALVVLANYTGIGQSVVKSIDTSVMGRASAIGNLKPGNLNALSEFRRVIREGLGIEPVAQSELLEGLRSVVASLTWNESPADLDLHLFLKGDEVGQTGQVYYDNTIFDDVELSDDVTTGFGPETAEIKMTKGWADIFVNNYSDDISLTQSGAKLILADTGSKICQVQFDCPIEGDGRVWHVCSIDRETGAVIEIGNLIERLPTITDHLPARR